MNALHPAIQAALAPYIPQEQSIQVIPLSSINDDDVYIYDAKTHEYIRSIGCKSFDLYTARTHGVEVKEGQTWGRGQAVKYLGLWRSV